MKKEYPIEYLDLQVTFAKKAAVLEGKSLPDVIFTRTSVKRMCNVPHFAEETEPVVLEIARAAGNSNPTDALYEIYLNRKDIVYPQGSRISSGFIQIEQPNSTGLFHIHFSNNGGDTSRPFDPSSIPARKAELKDVVGQLLKKYGGKARVGGGFSWLLGPLRVSGIFPPEFHRGALPKEWYGSLALWGQFLDGNRMLIPHRAKDLIAKVGECKHAKDLYTCFRYPVLEARAPIETFLPHLQIK